MYVLVYWLLWQSTLVGNPDRDGSVTPSIYYLLISYNTHVHVRTSVPLEDWWEKQQLSWLLTGWTGLAATCSRTAFVIYWEISLDWLFVAETMPNVRGQCSPHSVSTTLGYVDSYKDTNLVHLILLYVYVLYVYVAMEFETHVVTYINLDNTHVNTLMNLLECMFVFYMYISSKELQHPCVYMCTCTYCTLLTHIHTCTHVHYWYIYKCTTYIV